MNIAIGYRKDAVSDDILKLATEHARAFNGRVYILMSLKGKGDKSAEFESAESQMRSVKEYFEQHGVECVEMLLDRGLSPGEDIVRFSEENKIDEIIIGVVKISKVGKLLMGSTAQYVILHAPCPVIAVK
jgi:nucleotide-binding universal stress UspA family protein